MAKKKQELTVEEKLAAALVREDEQPYEVPGNWVWTRLGSVCSKVQYGYTAKSTQDEIGPKLLRITDIQDSFVNWESVPNCEISSSDFEKFSLDKDDIVVARTGATTGKSFLITENVEAVFASYLIRVNLNINFNVKYLYTFMQSNLYWSQIMDLAQGIAQPGVNATKLQNMSFPLPPLAEQQRIVDRIESLFDQLDQAKALIQEALDSFETRKAAILHQAFTGSLTKKWREEHGVGLESWEVDSLKNLCEVITDGTHQTPHYSTTGYVFLSSKNVTSGKIDWENIKYIPEELHNKLYARLAPQLDDILLAKNGTTGIGAIVDRDCVFDIYVSLALLRPIKSRITSKYLLYSINNPITKNKFNHELTGIGVQNLHLRDIRATTIPVPGLGEQQEIVRILDNLFEKEQAAQDLCDQIDQIETIKKTILGKAFRGELGTNVVGEESAVALLKEVLQGKEK